MSVRKRAVLMVEDELVITLDLERAIMDAGGFPVGPATTAFSATTSWGSNWVPLLATSSAMASSLDIAPRYGRSVVIAL